MPSSSMWQDMSSAPHDGSHVLLIIGETIPDLPDVRLGQFVKGREAREMGYREYAAHGGWFIWNDAFDWFVVDRDQPFAWMSMPVGAPFPLTRAPRLIRRIAA